MKIHITNLYNLKKDDVLVKRQHRFAEAGHALGFREMGIFSYPVETDADTELSKRLDGIIAALEPEDLVFIQLPTENGYIYERRLTNKIKAYKNTRIVFILHDMKIFSDDTEETQSDYITLYRMADAVIVPKDSDVKRMRKYGMSEVLSCENIQLGDVAFAPDIGTSLDSVSSNGYMSLCKNDFFIKKILMDTVETVFAPEQELVKARQQIPEEEIHIGFGLHDKTGNYSVWVGTTMQSIIEHTDAKICFHILHDETLNMENKRKLTQVALGGEDRICFHLLDARIFAHTAEQMKFYTIGAMFRIMLPEILSDLNKIIYLDADLLVNRDIQELWNMDISNYFFMAVPDTDVAKGVVIPIAVKRKEVKAERYFNSGVIYMNLERIRENGNMRKAVMEYLERTPESDLPDQDALNVIYNKGTLLLDSSWNYFAQHVYRKGEKGLEKRIYHYVGIRCLLYSFTEMDQLYYETVRRTPWGEEECRRIRKKSLERITDRSNQLEKLIRQTSAGEKKRIFYGEETNAMKNLYQILNLREGDYRILTEEGTRESKCILPCKNPSVLADEVKDTFVIFVLPEADKGNAIGRLEQMGLENGKDFFVIPRILSYEQGGYV